jgi:hypothetical protein
MQYSNGKPMNFISYIIAVVYRSYDDRGVDIPYFRTCMTVVLSLFIHAVQVGLVFNLPSGYIMPWSSSTDRSSQWIFGSIYFGFFILLFMLIFKRKKIEGIELSQSVIDRGQRILPIYLFINVTLLILLLVRKKVMT